MVDGSVPLDRQLQPEEAPAASDTCVQESMARKVRSRSEVSACGDGGTSRYTLACADGDTLGVRAPTCRVLAVGAVEHDCGGTRAGVARNAPNRTASWTRWSGGGPRRQQAALRPLELATALHGAARRSSLSRGRGGCNLGPKRKKGRFCRLVTRGGGSKTLRNECHANPTPAGRSGVFFTHAPCRAKRQQKKTSYATPRIPHEVRFL